MTYDPKSIANFFIETALAQNKSLTPIQVIKLVYIAHGWHLALTGEPLINESPEAWKYGPVIPSLYHTLKSYGNEPVTTKLSTNEMSMANPFSFTSRVCPLPNDPKVIGLLQAVWSGYGHFTGFQLSALTHQAGSPWHETWEDKGAKYSKGVDIPEDKIRDHYRELHKQRNAERRVTANS